MMKTSLQEQLEVTTGENGKQNEKQSVLCGSLFNLKKKKKVEMNPESLV